MYEGAVYKGSDDKQGAFKGLGRGGLCQWHSLEWVLPDRSKGKGLAEEQGKGKGHAEAQGKGQGKDMQAARSDGPAAAILLGGSDPAAQEVTSRPGAFATDFLTPLKCLRIVLCWLESAVTEKGFTLQTMLCLSPKRMAETRLVHMKVASRFKGRALWCRTQVMQCLHLWYSWKELCCLSSTLNTPLYDF